MGSLTVESVVEHLLESRWFFDTESDHETNRDEYRAEQERDTPAPREKLRLGQATSQFHPAHRHTQPCGKSHLGEAAIKATSIRVCVLDGDQRGPAPFAAYGQPLHDAQQDQENRRGESDAVVRRHKTDERGRNAHCEQRRDQHEFSSDTVAKVTRDDAAEWPCDEPDRECAECQKRSGQRIATGEIQLAKNECRGDSVEKEVEPLNGASNETGDGDRQHLR